MPSRSVVETYDYLRRIAPQFADETAQATAQAHNEAELEHTLNNAIIRIAFFAPFAFGRTALNRGDPALAGLTKRPGGSRPALERRNWR